MAVRRPHQKRGRAGTERGQSVIEFLFLLPVMLALALMVIRVNTAIQMSIVSQQYLRTRMTENDLLGNSPNYPSLARAVENIVNKNRNQMVLGMSESPIPETGDKTPVAPTHVVAPRKKLGSEEKGEQDKRTNVRVRNTLTICTQTVTVDSDLTPMLNYVRGRNGWTSSTPYNLTESTRFNYCASGPGLEYVYE